MKTSEAIDKIAPALLLAQKAMKFAAKDSVNPHFKSKYADLAAVIDAVKKPLNDAGITILQSVTNDSSGVMVQTTLLHESAQWIAETTFLPVPQQTPQAYGSAITYGRRYSLQSLVTLPTDDDDGNEASMQTPPPDRKDSARQVTVDAFESLPEDAKRYVRQHALECMAIHAEKGDIVAHLAEQNFDNEMKLALWSQLPSNVRAWIKDQEKIARANSIGRAMTTEDGRVTKGGDRLMDFISRNEAAKLGSQG